YPHKFIEPIFRREAQKQYRERLREGVQDAVPRTNEEVIVLKSEFNSAWNHFSAKELGDTVFKTWHTYLQEAERGEFTTFPNVSTDVMDLALCEEDLMTEVVNDPRLPVGHRFRSVNLPDIRKLGFGSQARWLVSRRRTVQLKDFVSHWKKLVLRQYSVDTNLQFEWSEGIPPKGIRPQPRSDIGIIPDPPESPSPPQTPRAVQSHFSIPPDLVPGSMVVTGRLSPDAHRTQFLEGEGERYVDLDE